MNHDPVENKGLRFIALDTSRVEALQNGQPDDNGQLPERYTSKGQGIPCRHCLQDVEAGDDFLALAYRPFPDLQPYAELGPIFLHAERCSRYSNEHEPPQMLFKRDSVLLKGYTHENRILYGTGQIVEPQDIKEAAQAIFENPGVAYIHVRSASNNCYTCRLELSTL